MRSAFALVALLFFSVPCPALADRDCSLPSEQQKVEFFSEERICEDSGALKRITYRFLKNGGKGSQYDFENGKVVHAQHWTLEGSRTADYRYRHLPDGSFLKDSMHVTSGKLLSRMRLTGEIGEGATPIVLQEWLIKNGKATELNTFRPGKDEIALRQLLDAEGRVTVQFEITYRPRVGYTPKYLESVRVLDASGKELGIFRQDGETDMRKILGRLKISGNAKKKLWAEYQRPKEPVLIIDSGFDLSHPDLIAKVWRNPDESVNGTDDDRNGRADDLHGWNILTKSGDINDSILLTGSGAPISHGTHVASIAFRGITRFGFTGYAGNMTDYELLEMARAEIQRRKIRFANFSFGWESEDSSMPGSPFTPGGESSFALENLVRLSPQTLFVAAAGNSGQLLELGKTCEIPPCLQYPNILKVGALNVATGEPRDLEKAALADFSNFSEEFVDLFAPGENVMGAGLGGQQIALSGTSMASPFVLNVLLKMSEAHPTAEISLLREILLKTVYVPDLRKPLPARSGGMAYPARAVRVAQLKKLYPEKSVEALVWIARKEGLVLRGEKEQSPEALRGLWAVNKLTNL